METGGVRAHHNCASTEAHLDNCGADGKSEARRGLANQTFCELPRNTQLKTYREPRAAWDLPKHPGTSRHNASIDRPAAPTGNPSAAHMLIWVICVFLLTGCDGGGGTIRHGALSYNATDVFGESTPALLLAKAAGRGDVKEINRLVAEGADVNAVGKHEITPLWWAAWASDLQGFTALLEKGANPNAQRKDGVPLMHLLTWMKRPEFLEAALKNRGDANLRDLRTGETPLFPAIVKRRSAQIELLFAAKADVNARELREGETLPMTLIAARVDYEFAYRLFQMGADPALKTKSGSNIADYIELRSQHASNNSDPWRAKVLEYLRSKGVTPAKPAVK